LKTTPHWQKPLRTRNLSCKIEQAKPENKREIYSVGGGERETMLLITPVLHFMKACSTAVMHGSMQLLVCSKKPGTSTLSLLTSRCRNRTNNIQNPSTPGTKHHIDNYEVTPPQIMSSNQIIQVVTASVQLECVVGVRILKPHTGPSSYSCTQNARARQGHQCPPPTVALFHLAARYQLQFLDC
jgi:hypothetical protein